MWRRCGHRADSVMTIVFGCTSCWHYCSRVVYLLLTTAPKRKTAPSDAGATGQKPRPVPTITTCQGNGKQGALATPSTVSLYNKRRAPLPACRKPSRVTLSPLEPDTACCSTARNTSSSRLGNQSAPSSAKCRSNFAGSMYFPPSPARLLRHKVQQHIVYQARAADAKFSLVPVFFFSHERRLQTKAWKSGYDTELDTVQHQHACAMVWSGHLAYLSERPWRSTRPHHHTADRQRYQRGAMLLLTKNTLRDAQAVIGVRT